MIVDVRIYTTKPGRTAAFVALYKEHAWPLQQKYLGRCLGWYVTVEGELNTVVHLWAYDDVATAPSAARRWRPIRRGRRMRRNQPKRICW